MKQILCILFTFFLFGIQAQEKKETLQEREKRYNEEANPFKEFGYMPRMITLSKGKYKEFFTDTIVQVCGFYYNRLSKKIVGVVKKEERTSESLPRPDIMSRWMSPDPLSEEFPSWSPYNFVNNNPIIYIDPTGLAPETIYENRETGATVEVNDGIDKTIQVNSTDFQQAKLFAGAINPSSQGNVSKVVPQGVADAYTDFYNTHNSYNGLSIEGMYDYAFNQPKIDNVIPDYIGGAGGLEFIGGPAKQAVSAAAKTSGRVFWSGKSAVAGKAAENFARANGMKTLEMTWQGKALTRLTNATSYKFTAPLWDRASASFARGATGPVNVFHNASSGVRLNSVWRNIEYPILKGNNHIIYHNVFK